MLVSSVHAVFNLVDPIKVFKALSSEETRIVSLALGIFVLLAATVAIVRYIMNNRTQPKNEPQAIDLSKLDPLKRQIIEGLSEGMIEALGGLEVVANFPVVEGEIKQEDLDNFTAPVILGSSNRGPFFVFCHRDLYSGARTPVTGECLIRTKTGWENSYSTLSECNLGMSNTIVEGSSEEKYMLDKIRRLMKGEPVGKLLKYSKDSSIAKPPNKDNIRPGDAYLKGDELEAYMGFETLFYEHKPEEGATDLFLEDLSKSKKENKKALLAKYPRIFKRD